jgi:hypothetical protein
VSLTPAENCHRQLSADTGGSFVTGVNKAGVDTGGAPLFSNIFAYFQKIQNCAQRIV